MIFLVPIETASFFEEERREKDIVESGSELLRSTHLVAPKKYNDLHFRVVINSIKLWNLPLVFYSKRSNGNNEKNSGNLNKSVGKRRVFYQN